MDPWVYIIGGGILIGGFFGLEAHLRYIRKELINLKHEIAEIKSMIHRGK